MNFLVNQIDGDTYVKLNTNALDVRVKRGGVTSHEHYSLLYFLVKLVICTVPS